MTPQPALQTREPEPATENESATIATQLVAAALAVFAGLSRPAQRAVIAALVAITVAGVWMKYGPETNDPHPSQPEAIAPTQAPRCVFVNSPNSTCSK